MEALFIGFMFLGLFGLIVLRIFIDADVSYTLFVAVCVITIVIFITGVAGSIILKIKPQPLDKQYQEKIAAIDTAEKELQKFLIDHPEFKELEGVIKDAD